MTTAPKILNIRYPAPLAILSLLIVLSYTNLPKAYGYELGSDFEVQADGPEGQAITPPALPLRPDIQNIFGDSNAPSLNLGETENKNQSKPSLAWRQKAYQLFYSSNKSPKTSSESVFSQSYSTVLKHLLNAFKQNNITVEEQELTSGQLLVSLPIGTQNNSCIFAMREFPKGTTTLRTLLLNSSPITNEKSTSLLQNIAQQVSLSLETNEAL